MIVLADGGSTKVDWRILKDGMQVAQVITGGMNPYFRRKVEIEEEVRSKILPVLNEVKAVYFYGAGCAGGDKNNMIEEAIRSVIQVEYIEIWSDLLAAARGLCGKDKGIACILGTGSNSCFYDGQIIVDNVSPLGYILGDEGSGAVLGKLFIGACLKNQLSAGIKETFLSAYELTPAMILDKVYRQPLPNRFLATISPFIHQHIIDESVRTIVKKAFLDFFERNVCQYEYKKYPVHCTGSVAYYFQELIRETASSLGIEIGRITASPMEGLIDFHR